MFKSFATVALVGVTFAFNASDIGSTIKVRGSVADKFEYMRYVAEHNKSYSTLDEFQMRFEIFAETNAIINFWNQSGEMTSTMGHNFLSDYTLQEKANLRGYKEGPNKREEVVTYDNSQAHNAITDVNWVTAGKVGPVKDQGQCGSCWAFSATGAVESNIAITYGGAVPNYSEQQLVSCSSVNGNAGCNGGWYYAAWDYMMVNAQENTSSYPYTSGSTGVDGICTANSSLGKVKVNTYAQIGQTNIDIRAAINVQPVSVAICAMSPAFQQYKSGVLSSNCGIQLDHAVIAVGHGFDATSGLDYFYVRNSWGASWGDAGYIKIAQSHTGAAPGVCGINQDVYTVTAATV